MWLYSIIPEQFGGKALPDDLNDMLKALQEGMKEALASAEMVNILLKSKTFK